MSSSDSIKSLPSSELIYLIKYSFHERRFNEAENILIGRENDMKMEIENLRRDRDSMKGQLERAVDLNKLEKLKLEEKLQENERKCDELEERVTRLLEEKKVSNDREKRAEERCDKVLAETFGITIKKDKFILTLMEKVDELKDINLENERLVGVYKEKYKRSDMKIVKMDQEIEGLKHESLAATKTIEELRRENIEANKTIDELRLQKSESDKLAEEYQTELEILWSRIKKSGVDLDDRLTAKERDAANLFNDVRKLRALKEGANMGFPGSKGKNVSSGNGSTPGDRDSVQPRTREDDSEHNTVKTPQAESDKHKEPLYSGAHASNIAGSSPAAGDVIEILDSDDEAKIFTGLNDEWAWKREALQMTKASINLESKRIIIKQVAEELKLIGDGVYQDFINSCFGFLMRFDTQGVCCNNALHRLFAHEVLKADASPDELWYRVGGQFIRFSKYEYALVTGLSFGPTTFDPSAKHHPPASGLFLRHYEGRNITMDALRSDFTDGVFRGSPADALKVAKLLIVYFLLFGMDGRKKYIDTWAWTLIEDTDQWETFMWGKYTYQILLRHLQRVPISKKSSYHVYGYVWAFLIWAYEAIPELGIACGVRTSDDALPRCIRWGFPKSGVDIDGFYDREMEVHSTLEPSVEEQRQPYWENIRPKNPFKEKNGNRQPYPDVPPGFDALEVSGRPCPPSCSTFVKRPQD